MSCAATVNKLLLVAVMNYT